MNGGGVVPLPVAVIDALLAAGVREFIICAGARNAALVVVLAALGDRITIRRHFEERAAAFFALGRIKATGRPVAVVTTSGTAVAELLPAMIEAHYQGLPLVGLTADRPPYFRGTGAPQAIEQAGLFGPYASALDLTAALPDDPLASWNREQPLHLNICLEEPDAAGLPQFRAMAAALKPEEFAPAPPDWTTAAAAALLPNALILAGDLADSEIPAVARAIAGSSAPVFAEAASGLRELPALRDRLIHCGDATLRHVHPQRVWRAGGVPSGRFWRDLESRPDIAVTSFSRSGHRGLARQELPVSSNPNRPARTFAETMAGDRELFRRLHSLLAQFPDSEPGLFRLLSLRIPEAATVFTGNSLAVRQWNLCAASGRGHRIHALRGANGIDGNLSAFLGLSADLPEAWCVTGDLTALYDLSAPWMLPQLPPGRRRFVIIQNGGGKIFSRLPALRTLTDRERALMENPHDISLRPWAELWNMDHARGGSRLLRDPRLTDSLADHAVLELYPDPMETEAFWDAWAAAEKEVWS